MLGAPLRGPVSAKTLCPLYLAVKAPAANRLIISRSFSPRLQTGPGLRFLRSRLNLLRGTLPWDWRLNPAPDPDPRSSALLCRPSCSSCSVTGLRRSPLRVQ